MLCRNSVVLLPFLVQPAGRLLGAKGWSASRAFEHDELRPRPALTPALPTAPWLVGI